ncbi:hypothetical protein [Methanogenium cariaci]|uniref:hypothetical protein n=1 Tax=Methanogenium cariaci TaxID=2197 RepID=UPI000783AFC7|nr:hypothetical protein [Methanogenium cariaci]
MEGEAKDLEIARLNALLERERGGNESRALRKDTEIGKLDTIIANQKKKLRREERKTKKLRKQVERLRRLASSQTGDDRLLVKATESLSRDAIRQVDADFGIAEGDIIAVKMTAGWGGTTVLDTLAGLRIRALVGDGDERLKDACLERGGIVLLHPKAIGLEVRGPVGGSADASRFTAAVEAWQKEIAAYEQGGKSAEMIESIFREYRTEREREVKKDG